LFSIWKLSLGHYYPSVVFYTFNSSKLMSNIIICVLFLNSRSLFDILPQVIKNYKIEKHLFSNSCVEKKRVDFFCLNLFFLLLSLVALAFWAQSFEKNTYTPKFVLKKWLNSVLKKNTKIQTKQKNPLFFFSTLWPFWAGNKKQFFSCNCSWCVLENSSVLNY
jgi:hypothetical protein